MAKKVTFAKPKKKPEAQSTNADAWVGERAPKEKKAPEPMKRFTIDVPVSLHARVKAGCAMRGLKMADVLRVYLEKEFPEE